MDQQWNQLSRHALTNNDYLPARKINRWRSHPYILLGERAGHRTAKHVKYVLGLHVSPCFEDCHRDFKLQQFRKRQPCVRIWRSKQKLFLSMKTYTGSRGTALLILNLFFKCGEVQVSRKDSNLSELHSRRNHGTQHMPATIRSRTFRLRERCLRI